MKTRTVIVTLVLTVTDVRKLRRVAAKRNNSLPSEMREFGPAELAQFIVDDAGRLELSEAGLEIESSESAEA